VSLELSSNPTSTEAPATRWGAFGHVAFTVIWTASMISNVGIAMFDTASGWYMTNLSRDPMTVSLVQAATSLPLFLFTLPAGALTDIVDPRRLLIVVEFGVALVSAVFAVLVAFGYTTPDLLLAVTFLLGCGGALCAPGWVSITPLLVPRRDLDQAVAANTVGYNLSRAVGPALGGLAIAAFGVALPFWIYAASNVVILSALFWWRQPRRAGDGLPTERLISAVRTGIRHARNNSHLHSTLVRTVAFFPFASAYWALLPLVARAQMTQGPQFYGLLLGAIGVGAIVGSLLLNGLKARLGPDGLVAVSTVGTAVALVGLGLAHDAAMALTACFLAGLTWTLALAGLYVSAQVALPDWVRGRGLAIFLTVIFGASALGSALWGQIAGWQGLSVAHFVAAAGIMLFIPLTWRFKLQTGLGVNLTPSLHWRAPRVAVDIGLRQGPVLITVEYHIDPKDHVVFLQGMEEVGRERKRDGAFAWGVFEDLSAGPGHFLETFLIESWLELIHLRERVTQADKMMEERVRRLLIVNPPKATFLIAPKRPCANKRRRLLHSLAAIVEGDRG
jgi:MFS family permease